MTDAAGSPAHTLGDDHEALDGWFEKFRATPFAQIGQRRELFERFANGLRRHIAVEERLLFPVFAEGNPAHRVVVELMLEEHRRIKEMLQRIDHQLEAGPASTEDVEVELLNVLWAHNVREEEGVYPWLDTHLSPDLVRSMNRELRDAESNVDAHHETG